MSKLINNTDLEDFIEYTKQYLDIKWYQFNKWVIKDNTNNTQQWQLVFNGETNEWHIFHIKDNFVVYFTMDNKNIEITKVINNDKTYTKDKYFNKYNDLVLLANSLFLIDKLEHIVQLKNR